MDTSGTGKKSQRGKGKKKEKRKSRGTRRPTICQPFPNFPGNKPYMKGVSEKGIATEEKGGGEEREGDCEGWPLNSMVGRILLHCAAGGLTQAREGGKRKRERKKRGGGGGPLWVSVKLGKFAKKEKKKKKRGGGGGGGGFYEHTPKFFTTKRGGKKKKR